MIFCHKCNSRMVEVKLISLRGKTYRAFVCTYCGHIWSKDKPFKKEYQERKVG